MLFSLTPSASNRTPATLEVTRSHLFARAWGREVFVKFNSGLPLREFARERTGAGVELWGLGVYAVSSKAQ